MSFDGLFTARLSRRSLLTIAGAVLPLSAVGFAPMGLAQETAKPATIAAPQQFSFDLLTEEMRTLSTQPHATAPAPEGFLGDLNYDDYRLIRFRDDRAR